VLEMKENHDRAIGRIEGKLDILLEKQTSADKKHSELYEKIDRIQRQQDQTDQKVAMVDQRLEKIEKPVAEFTRWRERLIGAAMLLSFIAAVVGGSAVIFWQRIVAAIKEWL